MLSIRYRSIQAEEVAILLGEKPKKKPAVEVEAIASVEPEDVPVAESDGSLVDPFVATEEAGSPEENVVIPESGEQAEEAVVSAELVIEEEALTTKSRGIYLRKWGLAQRFLKQLKESVMKLPSPIQAQAVPVILSGSRLNGASRDWFR